jgi:hypothetical protein
MHRPYLSLVTTVARRATSLRFALSGILDAAHLRSAEMHKREAGIPLLLEEGGSERGGTSLREIRAMRSAWGRTATGLTGI